MTAHGSYVTHRRRVRFDILLELYISKLISETTRIGL